MNLLDLERNDVEGAAQVYRDAVWNGTWKPALSTMLIQLQDEPEELLDVLAQLNEDPELARRLTLLVAASS